MFKAYIYIDTYINMQIPCGQRGQLQKKQWKKQSYTYELYIYVYNICIYKNIYAYMRDYARTHE